MIYLLIYPAECDTDKTHDCKGECIPVQMPCQETCPEGKSYKISYSLQGPGCSIRLLSRLNLTFSRVSKGSLFYVVLELKMEMMQVGLTLLEKKCAVSFRM